DEDNMHIKIGPWIAAFTAASLACAGASAQTNSVYRSANAMSGKLQRIGMYGNLNKDCSSGTLPEVTVVMPPKHGTLSVRIGKTKTKSGTRCPNVDAAARGVFYVSESSYTGTDEVSYEVRLEGRVQAHTVRINITRQPKRSRLFGAMLRK